MAQAQAFLRVQEPSRRKCFPELTLRRICFHEIKDFWTLRNAVYSALPAFEQSVNRPSIPYLSLLISTTSKLDCPREHERTPRFPKQEMTSKPLKTMEICDWYSSGDGVTLSKDSVSSGSYTGNLGIRKKIRNHLSTNHQAKSRTSKRNRVQPYRTGEQLRPTRFSARLIS